MIIYSMCLSSLPDRIFSFITYHCTACTEKLRQNDPGFVELSLERMGENFDLEDFVHALRCNATVKHVCFSGTFVRELAPEHWSMMLGAVGYLQTLTELQIWCSTIPVLVFAETIRRAQRLSKVYFFRVYLAGTNADFKVLAQAMKEHPNLRDFRIGGFTLTDDDVKLDGLVYAMAQMKSLEVVTLQLTSVREISPLSGDSLLRLVCSPQIKDLYLSRLGLKQEHFAAIAVGVALSNNLRVLDLFGNNVKNEHIQLFMKALSMNKSLVTMVLPCPRDDLTVDSCAAIALALKRNRTLTTLNLPRSNLLDDCIVHITDGLAANHTLKKIEVGISKDVGNKGREALETMLDDNYDLERLVVSGSEKSIKDKVEYYMRLNEVGRGTLLRDGKASREQWVDMLVLCKDNLDCLFYFLTKNPVLCQFANLAQAEVIITHEIRAERRHTWDHLTKPREHGENEPRKKGARRASIL